MASAVALEAWLVDEQETRRAGLCFGEVVEHVAGELLRHEASPSVTHCIVTGTPQWPNGTWSRTFSAPAP